MIGFSSLWELSLLMTSTGMLLWPLLLQWPDAKAIEIHLLVARDARGLEGSSATRQRWENALCNDLQRVLVIYILWKDSSFGKSASPTFILAHTKWSLRSQFVTTARALDDVIWYSISKITFRSQIRVYFVSFFDSTFTFSYWISSDEFLRLYSYCIWLYLDCDRFFRWRHLIFNI